MPHNRAGSPDYGMSGWLLNVKDRTENFSVIVNNLWNKSNSFLKCSQLILLLNKSWNRGWWLSPYEESIKRHYKINVQFKERLLNKRYLHAIELPITKRKRMKKWKHWWFIPQYDVPQYIFWTEVSSTFDFRENWFFIFISPRFSRDLIWFIHISNKKSLGSRGE